MPKIYGKMMPDYGQPLVDAVAVDTDAVKDEALGSFQSQINAAAFEVGADGKIKIKSDALPTNVNLGLAVVAALPETGVARTIYLVPSPDGSGDNTHDEFVWVNKGTDEEPAYGWERIGGVSLDVTNTLNVCILPENFVFGKSLSEENDAALIAEIMNAHVLISTSGQFAGTPLMRCASTGAPLYFASAATIDGRSYAYTHWIASTKKLEPIYTKQVPATTNRGSIGQVLTVGESGPEWTNLPDNNDAGTVFVLDKSQLPYTLTDEDKEKLSVASLLQINNGNSVVTLVRGQSGVPDDPSVPNYVGMWLSVRATSTFWSLPVFAEGIVGRLSTDFIRDRLAVTFESGQNLTTEQKQAARTNIGAAAEGSTLHLTGVSNSISLGAAQTDASAYDAIVANMTGAKLRINYIDSESIGWPFAAESIQRSEIVDDESTTYYWVTGIGQIGNTVHRISFKATYANETLSITDSVLEAIGGSTEQYDLRVSQITGTSTNDTNKAVHDLLAAGSYPRITINDGVETYAVTSYAHAEPVFPETTGYYILSVDGAYGSNIESVSGARIYEKRFMLDATGKLSRYKVKADGEFSEHDPLLIDGLAKQSDIDDINQVLFTQYTKTAITATTVSGSRIFEKGVPTAINVNWYSYFNNILETPTSLLVKQGDTVISTEPKDHGSKQVTLTEGATFSVEATIKGVKKTASATVNAYYPKYFGCHAVDGVSEQITAAIVTGLVKQDLTNTAVGSYSIPVAESNATYVWLCVPDSMSITEVMAGGLEFDLYQETPNVNMAFEVNVNGVVYKCYRSKNKPNAGTINLQITK